MTANLGALYSLNNHPLSAALAMLVLNIGGKYVDFGFTSRQETWLSQLISREIFIFAVVFVATKDMLMAVVITMLVTIFACFVMNENSRFCPFPKGGLAKNKV